MDHLYLFESVSVFKSVSPKIHQICEYKNTRMSSDSESSSTEDISKDSIPLSKIELVEKYESIQADIKDLQDRAFKGEATQLVQAKFEEMKYLFHQLESEKIRDTKIYLKDSEAFLDTSKFALTNARNINMDGSDVTLDRDAFLDHLTNWSAIDAQDDTIQADWLKLGILYQSISHKAIVSDSLNGPLATERKTIAPRARNIDDTQQGGASSTARQIRASDLVGDQEQNTANMVKSVYEKYRAKEYPAINFFRFFINPRLFAQSIENLFLTSFLIKDSRIKLSFVDGEPVLTQVEAEEMQEAKLPSSRVETRHHIASLDYKTWKYLVEKYDIGELFLGDRDEGEDTIPPEDL